MSKVIHLDETNFDAHTAKGVSLVDFWAPWCGPCKMLGPVMEEVAEAVGSKALIAKVNVDESPALAQKFNVMSIPAIFVMKDGKQISSMIGLQDKTALIKAISEV